MSFQLRVPGPTPVPDRVLDAMRVPMINHRGPQFAAMIKECREGLQWAFQTQNPVVIFAASGTGGLEAAVQNLVSPGQKAIFVTIGAALYWVAAYLYVLQFRQVVAAAPDRREGALA